MLAGAGCVTASSDMGVRYSVILAYNSLDTWRRFERHVTSRGVGACALYARRAGEGDNAMRERGQEQREWVVA